MYDHPEDHDKIEKLKDLIAWQVNWIVNESSGIPKQFADSFDKIQASKGLL